MITALYWKKKGDDPEARTLLKRLQKEGFGHLKKLNIERVFRLEGITEKQALLLKPLLFNPKMEVLDFHSGLGKKDGPVVEIGYQRAVADPELPSILRGASALGVPQMEWARIAHRYQFCGLDQNQALEAASHHLFNPQVQIMISPGEKWNTLKPQGETGPVEAISLDGLNLDQLVQLSENRRLFLNADQMRALQDIAKKLKRDLKDAELEMFAQTWSDHCFHTTWKSLGLLNLLMKATQSIHHPLVLSAFEDNAGVMEFYDGWALTLKGETHNSPTAVSPYGGIMTKHGGVIRDTLGCGQGAWPIGGSTIMGLGDPRMSWSKVPKGALHPKTILLQAIRGTADYVNPMGIPMMFPVYRFHENYSGKCFALGHSIGLIPKNRAVKGRPHPGDLVVLIGGLTGRDGLHGATVSSFSMTSDTAVVDAAHVQIGQPIEERKFMEAIPVLRDSNCLRAITDLGAAGLSSAAGEMGADTGIWINLAWVPLKTKGMRPWEIWISESQERMLLCVPPEEWTEAKEILERYEVPSAIIGEFTGTTRCQVVYDKTMNNKGPMRIKKPVRPDGFVVDLEFSDLRKACPLPRIDLQKSKNKQESLSIPDLTAKEDWTGAFQKMLSHFNLCDQSPAGMQFDNTVQGFTVSGPYGGKNGRMPNDVWISAPIRGKPYGAAASVAFNPFYGEVNPGGMAKLMILESITKLIATGVDLNDIVLCDNFYTPRVNSETACDLVKMVRTCSELSLKFGTPFISGKDSSSGSFVGENGFNMDVPDTLCVLALGRLPDVRKAVTKHWKAPENRLLIAGPLSGRLDGSVYLDLYGQRGTFLPDPDADMTLKTWLQFRRLQADGKIASASALGEGGLFRRLFEMALGGGMGCRLELDELVNRIKADRIEAALFSEMVGALLIEVSERDAALIQKRLNAVPIGKTVRQNKLTFLIEKRTFSMDMNLLISAWEKPFREVAL